MQSMINLKTPREIERMKGANRIVAEILLHLREVVRDGITSQDIDRIAEEMTLKRQAKPAFKGYRGFPASICVSINDEVVHGIPSPKRVVKSGDVVGLDFGVIFDGFFGDSAVTIPVGEVSPEILNLLKVTEQALYKAIEAAIPGNFISDVSAVQSWPASLQDPRILRSWIGRACARSSSSELRSERKGAEGEAGTGDRDRADDQPRNREGQNSGGRLDGRDAGWQTFRTFRTHHRNPA
jgi:methionyl aminopeptidase